MTPSRRSTLRARRLAAFSVCGPALARRTIAVSRRAPADLVERGAAAVLASWRRALRGVTGTRGRLRLAQAVDLAERFDREGGGRPGDLALYLSRATVESPLQSGVRVMTIHRAKGLEFDAVVLPALDRPLLRPPHAPVYLCVALPSRRSRRCTGRSRPACGGSRPSSRRVISRSWRAACATT